MSALSCSAVSFFSKAYLVSLFRKVTHSSDHPFHVCICSLSHFAARSSKKCNQNLIQYFKMWAFLTLLFLPFSGVQ